MIAERRIEAAILVALINNLSAAGFKPAAVCIDGEGAYVLAPKADGSDNILYEDLPAEISNPLTAAQVADLIFNVWDVVSPTIHFTHQHKLTWGHGVMVVLGNGEDFISDWHCGDPAFDAVVTQVSEAASEGAFDPVLSGLGLSPQFGPL